MATDSVIADIGETIVDLLRDRIDFLESDEIALTSPSNVGDGEQLRLTLYLYRIAENADLKNSANSIQGDRLEDPPLALDLHYLLTAHPATGGDNETARSIDQHGVLGRAMQVLQNDAILRGSDLTESLADEGEDVQISMNPMNADSFDQLLSLWSTFQEQPYQPSISYLISPVFIESTTTTPVPRVIEKTDRYYDNPEDQ